MPASHWTPPAPKSPEPDGWAHRLGQWRGWGGEGLGSLPAPQTAYLHLQNRPAGHLPGPSPEQSPSHNCPLIPRGQLVGVDSGVPDRASPGWAPFPLPLSPPPCHLPLSPPPHPPPREACRVQQKAKACVHNSCPDRVKVGAEGRGLAGGSADREGRVTHQAQGVCRGCWAAAGRPPAPPGLHVHLSTRLPQVVADPPRPQAGGRPSAPRNPPDIAATWGQKQKAKILSLKDRKGAWL